MANNQPSLTRNHPAMLRRLLCAMKTSCGNDSLRKIIMVAKFGLTVAMAVSPLGSNKRNSPPFPVYQSSFR